MLICREKVGGSQRIPLLTNKKEKDMILKTDYETTFKEGFRLGVRLTRAKDCYRRAADAKQLGDTTMYTFYLDAAKQWMDLAKNCGRKFTPTVAHDPKQSTFDFGDQELLIHNEPFERKTG
jgi:hypothetical protein|tara:strand:- start:2169 stop:2531 length:363 start_codon:yes stop_codon:yes gene_type:complete